jgi:microcystin-dependent protein
MDQDNTLKIMIAGIIGYILYRDFFSKKREGYSRRFGTLSGANNMVLTDEKGNLSSIQFPKGIIVAWQGTTAPEGWAVCDGSNGTPDLRGRFILGMNSNSNKNALSVRELGNVDGDERITFTITPGQMPRHNHSLINQNDSCGSCNARGVTRGINTGDRAYSEINGNVDGQELIKHAGGNEAITLNKMPPFYTLAYIMKL